MKGLGQSGVLLMTLAMLVFSVISVLAKYASATVPSTEVVFFRSLIPSIILLGWHLFKRTPRAVLLGKNRPLLLLRGILGALGINALYYAISGMPIADATLLGSIFPLFVVVLAAFFLKERMNWRQALVGLVSLGGAALVLKPQFAMFNLYGLSALTCAIFVAASHVCIRKLADEDTSTVILYFTVLTTVATAPVMIPVFKWPGGPTWVALIAAGILTVASQWLVTRAYRVEAAGRVAMVAYIGVFFSGLWDYIFWSFTPGWTSIVGAVLIIGSGIELHRQSHIARSSGPGAAG